MAYCDRDVVRKDCFCACNEPGNNLPCRHGPSTFCSQKEDAMMRRKNVVLLAICCLAVQSSSAQLSVTMKDISPDRSNNSDPDGASGGRVNNVATDQSTPGRVFAASEFGGIFRSTDNGLTWTHLDGHVPTVTSDVKVDPTNSNRVYATSFYDGRTDSRSGINVSTDGGTTWTHPATA